MSEAGLRRALVLAGLTDGAAGVALLRALASLWHLDAHGPVVRTQPTSEPGLLDLAGQVAHAGVVRRASTVTAGDAAWLRTKAGIEWSDGHLVTAGDRQSHVARPIRRQLAALGACTPSVLAEGAVRERRTLTGLTPEAVSAWARWQSDLIHDGTALRLVGGSGDWLRLSDPPVLALFEHRTEVPRPDILAALQHHGHTKGSAEVWLVRCAWLRSTKRGVFRTATDPEPQAI